MIHRIASLMDPPDLSVLSEDAVLALVGFCLHVVFAYHLNESLAIVGMNSFKEGLGRLVETIP
jgi:hypothetical protein